MMPSSSEISFIVSQQPVSMTCDWGARSPPSKSASPPSTSSASTSSAPACVQCSDTAQLRQSSQLQCRASHAATHGMIGFTSPGCGDWVHNGCSMTPNSEKRQPPLTPFCPSCSFVQLETAFVLFLGMLTQNRTGDCAEVMSERSHGPSSSLA